VWEETLWMTKATTMRRMTRASSTVADKNPVSDAKVRWLHERAPVGLKIARSSENCLN